MGKRAQYDRKDSLYRQAKSSGYRSRAAYKLIELDQRFGLLRPGMKVLDLGGWPGSWTQVVARRVGTRGLVAAVDLQVIETLPFSNVHVITGDAGDESVIAAAREAAAGEFDLIISDMSAKLTGIKSADQAAAAGCCEIALFIAEQALRPGGNLVMKAFKGAEIDSVYRESRDKFQKLVRSELRSTRKSSNELYIVGLGFKP